MAFWFVRLRHWLEDLRLRRAARRYRSQLSVIDRLDLPDEFKNAAKEQALNRLGRRLEHYIDSDEGWNPPA